MKDLGPEMQAKLRKKRRIMLDLLVNLYKIHSKKQCSGSGSVFLGIPDSDPLVRGMDPDPDPDPSIINKNSKKNLDSYGFLISFGLFIFEKLCKYIFKKYKQNNFFVNLVLQKR
jgi:hypothetical protein